MARQIELLEQIGTLIGPEAVSAGADWTISDFWFPELLVAAEGQLPAEDFARFGERWKELNGQIVQPKIAVLLVSGMSAKASACTQSGAGGPKRQMAAIGIEEAIQQIERGPILRLDATDAVRAIAEIVAAAKAA